MTVLIFRTSREVILVFFLLWLLYLTFWKCRIFKIQIKQKTPTVMDISEKIYFHCVALSLWFLSTGPRTVPQTPFIWPHVVPHLAKWKLIRRIKINWRANTKKNCTKMYRSINKMSQLQLLLHSHRSFPLYIWSYTKYVARTTAFNLPPGKNEMMIMSPTGASWTSVLFKYSQ